MWAATQQVSVVTVVLDRNEGNLRGEVLAGVEVVRRKGVCAERAVEAVEAVVRAWSGILRIDDPQGSSAEEAEYVASGPDQVYY